MADKLKYSTSQPTKPGLRTDNLILGTGDGEYGPTSTTSYLNGFTAPDGGYVVYTLGLNNTPKGWVASNDAELIDISRHLGNTDLTIKAAKVYLANLNNTWVFNSTPDNNETEGLECFITTENLTSYPETGANWNDISGRIRTHTINNTPSFEGPLGFLFDGVDDNVSIDPNSYRSTQTPGTMEVVFKPLDNTRPQVIASTTENRDRVISIVDSGHIRGCQYNGVLGDFCGGQYLPPIFEKFHHVSFSYTVDNGNGNSEYTLWVDGEQVANQLLVTTTTVGNDVTANDLGGSAKNYVDGGGRSAFGGVEDSVGFFNGYISKFATYNRFLTESEIKQNYYGAPIVTDGMLFSTDAGNLVAYENGDVLAYNLTGSLPGDLINGIGYSTGNGGAWVFDGTDEGIQFLADFDLSIYSSLTYEGWVKGQGVTPLDRWFSGTNGTANSSYHYPDLAIASSGLLHYIHSSIGTSWENTGIIIPSTEYSHIVFTFYNDGNVELFINGDLVFQRTHTPGTFPPVSRFMLGNRYDRNGEALLGNLSIARIYNRALTAGEVRQNFEAQRSRFGV